MTAQFRAPRVVWERAVSWWVWLIVIAVVAAVLVGGLLAIQVRRRGGGVIVDPAQSPRTWGRGRKR